MSPAGLIQALPLGAAPWIGAVLVAAPLAYLASRALGGGTSTFVDLASGVLSNAATETALLLTGIALFAGSTGTLTGWLVAAYRFPGRGVLMPALLLPLAFPVYIMAYVYADLTDFHGPLQSVLRSFGMPAHALNWLSMRTLPGAVFVFGIALYPYVHIATRIVFQNQGAAAIDAAHMLGCTRTSAFWRVALPLARPAIAAGLTLALLEALNDIGASEYLGIATPSRVIFAAWANRGDFAAAAQIAMLTLTIVAALTVFERTARGRASLANPARRARALEPAQLNGAKAFIAATICALPVILGFAIPAAWLAREVLQRSGEAESAAALAAAAFATLIAALPATAFCLALGAAVALAARHAKSFWTNAAVRAACLGYAVPSLILALGALPLFASFDLGVNGLTLTLFSWRPGLILSGSVAALVLVYAARFLAIAVGQSEAVLAQNSRNIDAAARMLGATPGDVTWNVHLPLLRPAAAAAALTIFVDCVKEQPATLLLRPLNFETLATLVYGHAARGSYEGGAAAALLIVLIGILPILHMSRLADKGIKT